MDDLGSLYEIKETLSKGPFCEVVVGRNKSSNELFLLKIFTVNVNDDATVDKKLGFRRELEIATALEHPHIARPVTTGSSDSAYWIVYPYRSGSTLAQLMANGRSMNDLGALRIIVQLLEALDFVHLRGVIHCDINPNNIFVSNDKEIELLDFGLSMLMQDAAKVHREKVIGTFPWLSPEQMGFTGLKIDTRSDVYCVALMLYTMLSGNNPFLGKTEGALRELLSLSIRTEVKPLVSAPAIVNRILFKALKPSPQDRYQTAAGLRYDIESAIREMSGEPDRTFLIGEKDARIAINQSRLFVSRLEELSHLQQGFQRLESGKTASLVLWGPSGIGKTEIIRQFRESIDETKNVFLAVKCNRFAPSQPYWAFRSLMQDLVATLAQKSKTERVFWTQLFKNQLYENSGFVCAVAPETNVLFEKVAPREEVQPEKEADRIVFALSRFLIELCKSHSIAFFIDDLQWVDRSSLEIFKKLLEEKCRVLLIANVRTEQENDLFIHGSTLQEINIQTVCKVSSFSRADIRQLVVSRFGLFDEVDKLADVLYTKTDGSPLTISEACRYLVHNNMLKPVQDGWELNSAHLAQLPEKFDAVSLVLGKIEQLTDIEILFLEIASLVEGKFEIDLIAQAGDLKEIDALAAARRLELFGFLSRGIKGNYAFGHDRVHETIRGKVSKQRQATLYEKLGFLCEEMAKTDQEYLFSTAEFFLKSKNTGKAIESSFIAAEYAKGKTAFDAAVKYYKNASLVAANAEKLQIKSSVDIVKIQMGLGEVLLLMGNNEQALTLFEALLEKSPANCLQMQEIRYAIGVIYSNIGEFTKSLSFFKELLFDFGIKIPQNRVQTIQMLLQAFLSILLNNKDCVKKTSVNIKLQIQTLNCLTYASYFEDVFECMMFCFKTANFAKKVEFSIEKAKSLTLTAIAFYHFLLKEKSIKTFVSAKKIASNLQRKDIEASITCYEGMASYFSAKWAGAESKFKFSIQSFKEIGYLSEQIMCFEHLWRIALMQGNLAQSQSFIFETISISERTKERHYLSASLAGSTYLCALKIGKISEERLHLLESFIQNEPAFLTKTHVSVMFIMSEMVLQNYSAAYGRIHEFISLVYKKSFNTEYNVPFFVISCDLSILYLRKEKTGQKLLDVPSSKIKKDLKKHLFMLRFSSISYPAYRGSYYRIKAWQAALKKQPKRAIKLFDRALHEFHKLDMRYEEAKTYREYGEFYSDVNMPGMARDKYNEAYRLFLICGADYEAQKIDTLVDAALVKPKLEVPEGVHSTATSVASEIDSLRVDSLHEVCSSMVEAENIEVLSRQILTGCIKATGAQFGYIIIEEYDYLEARKIGMSFDGSDLLDSESYLCDSIVLKVKTERKSIAASDIDTANILEFKTSKLFRSAYCVPLSRGDKYIGCLYLGSNLVSGLFSESSQKTVEIIAAQAGIMLENAFLMDRYRRSASELESKVLEQTRMLSEKNHQLEESTIKLTENEQMKNIFAGTLVHDIKNYVMVIEGSAQIMELRAGDNVPLQKSVVMVKESCKDIVGLASNLLDIQKIEDGHMPIKRELLEPSFVNAMVDEFKNNPTFLTKNIAVFAMPPVELVHLEADQYLLKRIIQNLMSNAGKYGAPNGEVVLTYEVTDSAVTLSLFSTGAPIPENYRDILFDKYNQTGQDRSQYSKGLGLFFCKVVMQAHGGRIWVEADDRGNIFKMTFPYKLCAPKKLEPRILALAE